MDEALRLMVGTPHPDDDAAAVYSAIHDQRTVADVDNWFNDLAGSGDPAASGAAPEASAAKPASATPEPVAAVPAPAPGGGIDGLVSSGNIDLTKRPIVKNADGTISTVRSMSFEQDGKEILVPTVSPDGRIMSDEEAIQRYQKTGENLGIFNSADAATAYAQKLHEDQAAMYGDKGGHVPGDGSDGWTLGDAARAIFHGGGDVLGGIGEAPKQAVGGVVDALGEIDQFMQQVLPLGGAELFDAKGNFDPRLVDHATMVASEKLGQQIFQMVSPDEAKTGTGGMIRSTAQFLTAFLPATAALSAAAPGLAAGGIAAGAAALSGMVAFDPHQDRLSTFLNQVPALSGIVPDYLADNDPAHETDWQGRMKNAAEAAGLQWASDGLIGAFKYYKAARQANQLLKVSADPIGAQQVAARDALAAEARKDLIAEVPDEALAPLGDEKAPLLIPAKQDETFVQATGRLKEAQARADLSVVNNQALANVNAVRENFAAKAKVAGRDPIDDMLDELRSGAVSKGNLPARPVSTIVKGLGGVDPTSSLAGDLRSRGITAKSFPGLFKKDGLKALDNVPGSEHPVFADHVGGDGYVKEQSFIDGLEAELKGQPFRTPGEQAKFADLIGPTEELDQSLSKLGIDYENMSNASVKARLQQITDEEGAFARGDNVPAHPGRDEMALRVDNPAARRPADATQAPGKVYLNTARIQSADDVRAVMQQMVDIDADHINTKRGGEVVTNEQTIKASSKEYQDINDLIGRPPGPMNAAQAVAARRLLVSSGEQIVQLARKAADPGAAPADIYNFRRAMAVHYAIQSEVVAARTETARALQSWAIPAGATRARSQAITDLIASGGGAPDIQAMARAVSAVDNPAGLNAMAQELGRGRFGKALYQVWINGLLSGPKTHLANILSNSMVALWAIPERYVAAGISRAFYSGEIAAGEAGAQAFGMVKGIRDGIRLAYLGNKAEGQAGLADVFDAFGKADSSQANAISAQAFGLSPNGGMGYGIDMISKLINLPGSALQGEDRFFKSIGYRMELQALAFRQASTEGLEGKDFAARVVDIIANPPASLKADALDTAAYQTFTNPLSAGARQALGGIAKTPVLGPVFKWVVPFTKTPTNILKYSFSRTPLAYLSASIRADVAAGGARAAQAHARVALGSMLMLTMADMAGEGTITGSGPLDKNVRKAWLDDGNLPYSVRVGGRSYQYSRADPIGMMVGLSADMAEILAHADEEDGGRLVTAGAVALASNLANKTYMSGIFDFIGAIDPNNPSANMGNYVANQVSGLVPYSAFLRTIQQGADPVMRDPKTNIYEVGADGKETGNVDPVASYLATMVNTIKKGIPGLSDELPPMRDLWGEDVTKASGMGWAYDAVSPIASRVDNPDPVDSVIIDNNISVSAAPRIINGVRLSNAEYADFVRQAGRPAKAYLDQLIASPGFKGMSGGPDGLKAEMVKDVINNFRDQAAAMILQKNPQLRERAYLRDVKRNQLLTGQ